MTSIRTETLTITLAPALPPFLVRVTLLKNSFLLYVGASPGPYSLMRDFASAVPGTNSSQSASTNISRTGHLSSQTAARLSKRYKQQVFLSLDLGPLATQGGMADQLVHPLERALIQKLDPILRS